MIFVLSAAACGYRFPGKGDAQFSGLKTVYVDHFVNKTQDGYAAQIMRSAFIGKFVEEGRFTLVPTRDRADVVCRGTIRSIQIAPLSYKASNIAAEERMTVVLEAILEETAGGRILWENRALSVTGDYLATPVAMVENNRKNALLKLADDAAERAYQLMMSDF